MEFKTDGQQHVRLVYIDILHRDESLNFSMKSFNRTTFTDTLKMFDNTNKYLSSLEPKVQDEIFNIFKEVKETFLEIHDSSRVHIQLTRLIAKLFKIITFDKVKDYFNKYATVRIPPDLKDSFTGEDNELTRQLTYLRKDYYDLVILSGMLKFAAPIFGEYLEIVDKEVGSKFKEYKVYTLLSKSNIIYLESFKRLQVYVDASIEKEKRKNQSSLRTGSSIFAGLGTQELPGWLISKSIIRKLMLHEELSENSAIASIYHSIEQHINSLDKSFGGTVRDKKAPFKDNEGDKTSLAENYKIKQTISDGDLSLLSAYMDELDSIILKVEPNINRELLAICNKNLGENSFIDINTHQMTLSQWVLSSAISPRGIPALNKSSLLKALAGTQAVLWQWGFKELAILMTSVPHQGEDGFGGSVARIDNKTVQLLNELYPYHQIKSKNLNSRNTNPALKAINKMSAAIIANDWYSYSPKEMEEDVGINPKNKVIYASPDVSLQLANLIIKINETDIEYRR